MVLHDETVRTGFNRNYAENIYIIFTLSECFGIHESIHNSQSIYVTVSFNFDVPSGNVNERNCLDRIKNSLRRGLLESTLK